jgi:apolipoprotein N-acyltransferase
MLTRLSPRLRRWLSTLTGALLLAAAFPPSPLWILAFPALALLLHSLEEQAGFGVWFVAGLVFFASTVYWIGLNSDPPPLLAAASGAGAVVWLSLLWGLTGGLLGWLRRRLGPAALWLAPPLWTSVDWLAEGTEMGFPWALAGATQVGNPLLRPLAALGGIHALTLALLLAAVLLLRLAQTRGRSRWAWGGLALWLALTPLLGGLARGDARDTGESLGVLLVQGNIDPEEKWNRPWVDTVMRHLDLTRQALDDGARPELVIWPETAVPTRLRHRPQLMGLLAEFCGQNRIALLTGANDGETRHGDGGKPYNGSFLFTGDGLVDDYRKVRLVPFGERVPGQRWVPLLGRINLGQAEFAPGTDLAAGRLPRPRGDSLRFSWSICFEGNFAEPTRTMVLDGAALLTNQTNDAWFGTSRELDQHLALSRLRAVETGRWLVRACNNGYSAAVDPDGRVRQLLPKGGSGTLAVSVPLREGHTFHTRFGDLLPRLCLLWASWGLLLALLGTRRRTRIVP